MTSTSAAATLSDPRPPVRGFDDIGRCRVIGVVNVTPDSFSDGGRHVDPADAVKHALQLVKDGADLVDVGGESTRPGATRVDAEEEVRRVRPVIRELVAAGVTVSIDTMRATTAAVALDDGALLVNDVSGGVADPELPKLIARTGAPYVVMHWRGHSADMQSRAEYDDVLAEVRDELRHQIDAVVAAGVEPEQIVLDPGLGFAKRADHNWALLSHLADLTPLGRPLLVGASRKSFLGSLLAGADGQPRDTDGRDDATAAVSVIAALAGAWAVRVHDVAASADAVRVVAAVAEAGG